MMAAKVWNKDELISEAKKFETETYNENNIYGKTGPELAQLSDGQAADFRKTFPIKGIKNLTADEYVKRGSKTAFLYWILYKPTKRIAAVGHVSYTLRSCPFNEAVRESLVNLYELVERDALKDFSKLDPDHKIDLQVKLKICYILKPDRFLAILSGSHLDEVLERLGLAEKRSCNPLEKNRAILEYFRSIPFFKEWHTHKLKSLCYNKLIGKPEIDEVEAGNGNPVPAGETGKLESIDVLEIKQSRNHHDEFEKYLKNGQIAFVTFHQSYSYEDFMEGFRPKLQGNNLGYTIKDGIFKKMCACALKAAAGETDWNNNTEWKNVCDDKNKTIKYEYLEIPSEKWAAAPRFVLIIDEINRGNISKIFGELITLIESNKRLGTDEKIKVRLPYSGEEFGVPRNVYIIGTMNSTDKSIALVDIALRRRFWFERIPVNYTRINNKNAQTFLEKLNPRICAIKDEDHEIGHSYFMEEHIPTDDNGDALKEVSTIKSSRSWRNTFTTTGRRSRQFWVLRQLIRQSLTNMR